MSTGILRHLLHCFRQSFEGPAWHGPSFQEFLDEMEPESASVRGKESHSPLELLLHIVIWRRYVIRNLKGDHALATEEELRFPSVPEPGEYAWTDARVQLDQTQEELLDLLKAFPEERLDKKVPGRDYDWSMLLHGLLQHDAYHLGQMRLLVKHF